MAKKIKEEELPKTEYQFFGEVDLNEKGKINSALPSWTFSQLIEDLEEDIRREEINYKDTSLGPEARGNIYTKLKLKKDRLDAINESKPKVNNDVIYGLVGSEMAGGSLGDKIAESMFTRDQMMTGIADAREEARRMVEPIIKLDSKEIEMAYGCGIRPTKDGKVSRDAAVTMWKIGRKYLGELSNAELLRR